MVFQVDASTPMVLLVNGERHSWCPGQHCVCAAPRAVQAAADCSVALCGCVLPGSSSLAGVPAAPRRGQAAASGLGTILFSGVPQRAGGAEPEVGGQEAKGSAGLGTELTPPPRCLLGAFYLQPSHCNLLARRCRCWREEAGGQPKVTRWCCASECRTGWTCSSQWSWIASEGLLSDLWREVQGLDGCCQLLPQERIQRTTRAT